MTANLQASNEAMGHKILVRKKSELALWIGRNVRSQFLLHPSYSLAMMLLGGGEAEGKAAHKSLAVVSCSIASLYPALFRFALL